jgi:predicted Zn-ribbon and HTH transcriptional regulator
MSNYIKGGKWIQKATCQECGWEFEKKELKSGLCKTCREGGKSTKNASSGESDGKGQEG